MPMNPSAQTILHQFDQLPNQEQCVIGAEILKRLINFDLPPLTDEDLLLNAEAIFLTLEAQEANDE